MMQKVYISGQITGLDWSEYSSLFGRAESLLLDHELIPFNPLKIQACHDEDCSDGKEPHPAGGYLHDYKCYIKYDILAMLECDTIAMLPNWQSSKGAEFELAVAIMCGLDAIQITDDYTGWREIKHV